MTKKQTCQACTMLKAGVKSRKALRHTCGLPDGAMPQDDEPLGATGRFPQGKLSPHDEGEIKVGMTTINGRIVINFGKPVAWVAMTKEEALAFAAGLIKQANK